jgi:nitrogen fixation/metabolism regulation signal transduction histidine kinase
VDSNSFLRRFRLQIVIRLALMALSMVGICYLILVEAEYLLAFLIGLVLYFQSVVLIRTIERITRDLVSFLEAIEYSDFTQSFTAPYSDAGFRRLYGAFSNVMKAFQKTRAQSEAQRRYLETLVHHVSIGLICFRPDGEITLMNNAAKRLLERPSARRVQDLSSLSNRFAETLMHIGAGEQRLEKVDTGSESLQLAINATRCSSRRSSTPAIFSCRSSARRASRPR